MDEKKEIEVITGDGKLNISKVEDSINSFKKKKEKKDKIFIPLENKEEKETKKD